MNRQWEVVRQQLRKYGKRALRLIGWTSFTILAILLILILLIRLPAVQNRIVHQATSYLQEKIGTEVSIGRILISLPKTIEIEDIFLRDQSGDTLLFASKIGVDANLPGLFKSKISLNAVELTGLKATVNRTASDSTYNFDYIVNAFAAEDSAPQETDTVSSSWQFSMNAIDIINARLVYGDSVDGNFATAVLGTVSVDFETFDLEESILKFGDIVLSNSKISFEQNIQMVADEMEVDTLSSGDSKAFQIGFGDVELDHIRISYVEKGADLILLADMEKAVVEMDEFNLERRILFLDRVNLLNTHLTFTQGKQNEPTVVETKSVNQEDSVTEFSIPWSTKVNELILTNNSIQYYNFAQPASSSLPDPNRLWVYGINIEAGNISAEGQVAEIHIEKFTALEKKGLQLKAFQMDAVLKKNTLDVAHLFVQTGVSRLNMEAHAQFTSLNDFLTNPGNADVRLQLTETVIALGDIPFLEINTDSLPVRLTPSSHLFAEANISGKVSDLKIQKMNLRTLDSTRINISGSIQGLPDMDRALMQIQLHEIQTTREELNHLLKDSVMPSSITVPAKMNLEGTLQGSFRSPEADLVLNTTDGKVFVTGKIDLDSSRYNVAVKTEKIHLGHILQMDGQLETLDAEVNVIGSGFTSEDLHTVVDLTIQSIIYKGYDYKNFKVDGKIDQYLFSGTASMKDENVDFLLTGDLDYAEDATSYKFKLDLKNLNLENLHLSEQPLRLRGLLEADLQTADFKRINGTVDIRKFALLKKDELYAVDSLLFASIDQTGSSEISIRSDILTGDFKGTINLFSLPDVLRQHFNEYFALRNPPQLQKEIQNFSFELIIKDTDLLTEVLIPDLEPFTPGQIKGSFDSEAKELNLELRLSEIRYGTTGVDSILFLVDSDPQAIRYKFALKNLVADTLHMDELNFTGRVANDSIVTFLHIMDGEETKYRIGSTIQSVESDFRFHLIPGQILLNYGEWGTPSDNFIQFGSSGLQAHDFDITKGNQKISITTGNSKDSVVAVVFRELELGNLTRLVAGVVPASGELNGDFKFTTARRGEFQSDLKISDLVILQEPWGDLTFHMDHVQNKYNMDMLVRGNNTNLTAKGYYTEEKDTSALSIAVNLAPFNLQLVRPFSMGQLLSLSGTAEGKLKLEGPPSHPFIEGDITFKEANFTSSYLNNTFVLKDEKIVFGKTSITFNNFRIQDVSGNMATVTGTIKTPTYTDLGFNLKVTSRNFQVMDKPEDNDQLVYGKLKLNLNASISGDIHQPRVNVQVKLSDDSNITYVVPPEEKGILEQKGIIEFIDRDAVLDPFLAGIKAKDTVRSSFLGAEITALIELSGKETLNIVIDPVTGDKLTVRGNANLTFEMDPIGNMNLSGRYEISEGSYNLSFYKLVKREFTIEKGGSITWAGDPLNAELDIRASNLVETSPLDLVANQISTTNQTQMNQYRQRLPFLVYLRLRGDLLAPEISFSIDMPQANRNAMGGAIYAKLQDINTRESDLNKQVFALLILKRFISDNPLESQAGSDLSNTTRNSVSRLLSEQLNRLSENIKGVQLSLDVKSYEDYTTGAAQGRTSAQLGVSKSLFDDRLVVKLSGNVDIEGPAGTQNEATDYIGDLALEYKMTSDGRFRVTGFRKSNYDMIDGELTETGAGLIYIKDYNTLRELFSANATEK